MYNVSLSSKQYFQKSKIFFKLNRIILITTLSPIPIVIVIASKFTLLNGKVIAFYTKLTLIRTGMLYKSNLIEKQLNSIDLNLCNIDW